MAADHPGAGARAGAPVHEGDVVTARGRDGVWRVHGLRRGAARLVAIAGTGGVRATTVPVEDVRAQDEVDRPGP